MPRATTAGLTEPPALAGAAAPRLDAAPAEAQAQPTICPAWGDQEIDTAGTEADLWFPRGDGGA